MVKHATALALMQIIKKFERAMDGPSADAEVDAACAMRDAALEVLGEAAAEREDLKAMLRNYEEERLGLMSKG